MLTHCVALEKTVVGLVKFFSKPEYIEDFLRGRLYCNTPQFYRDSNTPGLEDDFEACIAYFNRKKHQVAPSIVIDGQSIDLTAAESVTLFGDSDQRDAHLHCWFAIDLPTDFDRDIPVLQADLHRVRMEFGPLYVFLPAANIEAYGNLLDAAVPDGFLGSHVQYTDDWRARGMFRKRTSFAYQREYRFAIGSVPKNHSECRILEAASPLSLVDVCPTIWFGNLGQKVCLISHV